jgi:hypothetical protein
MQESEWKSASPAPDLAGMGYAQRMALLDELLDATTQKLCNEFGLDPKSMALALSTVQNRWVMSIATDVVLR